MRSRFLATAIWLGVPATVVKLATSAVTTTLSGSCSVRNLSRRVSAGNSTRENAEPGWMPLLAISTS